jgi:hypothetical protein
MKIFGVMVTGPRSRSVLERAIFFVFVVFLSVENVRTMVLQYNVDNVALDV